MGYVLVAYKQIRRIGMTYAPKFKTVSSPSLAKCG